MVGRYSIPTTKNIGGRIEETKGTISEKMAEKPTTTWYGWQTDEGLLMLEVIEIRASPRDEEWRRWVRKLIDSAQREIVIIG